MFYAYFNNKEKYEFFYFFDKLANGERVKLPRTISDLKVRNIYKYNKEFKQNIRIYISTLNSFCKAVDELLVSDISSYPSIQEFIIAIKQITDEEKISNIDNIINSKENWCLNKKLFRLDNYSVNGSLINSLAKLFFYYGYLGQFTFDNLYKYISSFYREDYQNPREKKISKKQSDSISCFLQKNDDFQSLCKDIKYLSIILYLRQHKLFKELCELRNDLIDMQTLYMRMNVAKDGAVKELCKFYFVKGETERLRLRKLTVQQQIERNNILFNGAANGFIVEKRKGKMCKICGLEKSNVYDVIACTPFEHTLVSSCAECLIDVDASLQQIIISKYSEIEVANQMMVSYKKYDVISARCLCCGKKVKAFFEVDSIRNPKLKFCKDCFEKLSTNINKKTKKLAITPKEK